MSDQPQIKLESPHSPKESSSKEELRPKVCLICGDATNTYHYDIASCYGCKTFFRRAIIGTRKYVCNKGGNCPITKDTRCICRACRLKKCIEMGMNPSAVGAAPSIKKEPKEEPTCIKNEPMEMEETEEKKDIVVQQVQKQQQQQNIKPSISYNLATLQDEIDATIQNLLYLEEKHEYLRKSNFSPFDEHLDLNQMLQSTTSFGDADKYTLVQTWPRYTVNETNMTCAELRSLGLKAWFFVDLLLSVDYMKTFSIFKDLPLTDQFNLCYDVIVVSTHLTRSYYAYAMGAEVVLYPDGSYPFYTRPNPSAIEYILRAGKVRDFARIRPDRVQYCLMRAISSFNTVSQLITKDSYMTIEKERNRYAKILLCYLQDKYGVEAGAKKFADSIATIIEFIKMKKDYTETYHACKHCFNIPIPGKRPDPHLFCDLIHGH